MSQQNESAKESHLKSSPGPSSCSSSAMVGRAVIITVALLLLSALLQSLAFAPFDVWPLAFCALTPAALAVMWFGAGWRILLLFYGIGAVYFGVNCFWLAPITSWGLLVLAMYLGLYWLLFAKIFDLVTRHLHWPAMVALPLIFTSLEYLRDTLFSGFAWFTLGTAVAPAGTLLQVADLFGVSGLTFLTCVVAGYLADVVAARRSRRAYVCMAIETLLAVALLIVVYAYGVYRLNQRDVMTPGPRVAVIQQYIPQTLKDAGGIKADRALFNSFMRLSRAAAGTHPNLIAWPETMIPGFMNRQWLSLPPVAFSARYTRRLLRLDQHFAAELAAFSHQTGIALLVGASYIGYNQQGRVDQKKNVALMVTPSRGLLPVHYAKHHLVPFGEYVPFAQWPWLHRLLLYLTPFGPNDDYSLNPGRHWTRFTLKAGKNEWRFGTPICYEDVMPRPSRMLARPHHGKKGADFLISISNDGWYDSSFELDQHLQMDQLRAVENRVPIARSVNGGDCGFIDSLGRVIKLVRVNGRSNFVRGYAAATLPIDRRISLFSRIGDIFPRLLLALTIVSALWAGIWAGLQGRKKSAPSVT